MVLSQTKIKILKATVKCVNQGKNIDLREMNQ